VKIDAMATVNTINVFGSHLPLLLRIMNVNHSGVLPWVFTCGQEEDVLASDLEATEVVVGVLNSWRCNPLIKNPLTIIKPKVDFQSLRPGWMEFVGDLEPSELSAVLVSPLSDIL